MEIVFIGQGILHFLLTEKKVWFWAPPVDLKQFPKRQRVTQAVYLDKIKQQNKQSTNVVNFLFTEAVKKLGKASSFPQLCDKLSEKHAYMLDIYLSPNFFTQFLMTWVITEINFAFLKHHHEESYFIKLKGKHYRLDCCSEPLFRGNNETEINSPLK